MSEPDFSGINPLRVPTARKRLAAIQEYLAIPDRKVADAVRISATVGMSRWSFQRLVKAWIQYRRVDLLVENKKGKPTRKPTMSEQVRAVMKDEIKKAGADAELALLKPIVRKRCEAEGLKIPSDATLKKHIVAARTANPEMIGGPPRIVIGRISFHLPVALSTGEGAINPLPHVLLAVALPECAIIASDICVNEEQPPDIEQVVHQVLEGQTEGAEGRQLLIDPMDRRLSKAVFRQFGVKRPERNRMSVQREMARIFGSKFGMLEPIYRPNLARPGRRNVLSRQDQPITEADAIGAIQAAIDSHNASRLTSTPEYTIKR